MAAGDRALAAWQALNLRQQAYLETIYDADQAAEADIRARRARWEQTPAAAEWRLLTYSVADSALGHTTIQGELRRRGKLDPGAGSTLGVLERRRLVAVVHDWAGVFPRVRGPADHGGRAAARAGRGDAAPVRTPPGLMSEWGWSTLARLYPAGDQGLPRDTPRGAPQAQRAPSWNALLVLRDRRDGPYMEETQVRTSEERTGGPWSGYPTEWHVRITELGREHYERHHACYRELYPGVDAPVPAAPAEGAHAGLADHRKRRPAGLVPEPQWRLLAELAALEQSGTCHLRNVLTEDHQRAGEPVPEAVTGLPCGLLPWQIQRVTRSATAAGQLADRPGGPLAEVVDVVNPRWMQDSPATLPLLCLTEAGRAHYGANWAAYRALYPEVDAPEPSEVRASA